MPLTLLPSSAAAFAPRSAPTVVLSSRVEPWLTQALKRIHRTKRPLNSVQQHTRCLTDVLSGPNALWALASIIVPRAPDSLLCRNSDPLSEALENFQFIHIEAYVVHIDMVSQNDVAYKLTIDSIKALTDYHKDIYSVDVAASTWNWSGKDQQLRKLHEDFVQAVNKYVFRTDVKALEGLEDEGAGELLEGRSQEVKNGILGLFLPLLPPPPRVLDVLMPTTLAAGGPGGSQWWPPAYPLTIQTSATDNWHVHGSSPVYSDPISSSWTNSGAQDSYLPSPALSNHQLLLSPLGQHFSHSQAMTPRLPLPLPSAITQQCGAMASTGYSGYTWSSVESQPQYSIYA